MALLSDVSSENVDYLDFTPYALSFKDLILNEDLQTPLTIGIFGSWGTGKSSLMRLIEEHLKQAELREESERLTHPIWFNAWRYSKEDSLWRALLARVVSSIRSLDNPTDPEKRKQRDDKLDALINKLYQTMAPSELGSLSIEMTDIVNPRGSNGAQMTLSLQQGLELIENVYQAVTKTQTTAPPAGPGNTDPLSMDEEQLASLLNLQKQVRQTAALLTGKRIEFIEQFQEEFEKLMQEYVVDYGYLVIFVDDLDRCLPEKAVEILEAMKLFLDVEGCIFVLAIDQDVVERGIQIRYGEMGKKTIDNDRNRIDGRRYLEKIIQIPFVLPPISRKTMGEFIFAVAPNLPEACGEVLVQGLVPNPRHVKRAINIYTLLERLAQNKPLITDVIKPVRLAKIVVLQQRFAELYETLRKEPERLKMWEENFRSFLNKWPRSNDTTQTNVDFTNKFEHDLPALFNFSQKYPEEFVALKTLLTMHSISEPDVNFSDLAATDIYTYLYLASTVEDSESQPVESKMEPPAEKESGFIDTTDTPAKDDYYAIYSGLETGRKSFITNSIVQKKLVEVFTNSGTGAIDASTGAGLLQALAEAGSDLYYQLYSEDKKRAEFEQHAGEIKRLRIDNSIGEDMLPWELVYADPLQSRRLTKGAAPVDGVASSFNSFWGGHYVIERPYALEIDTAVTLPDPPAIHYMLDPETPTNKRINAYMQATPSTRQLHNTDNLRDSIKNQEAQIYVIHGHSGIDSVRTWISLGSKDLDDAVNLSELRKVVTNAFIIDELRILCKELDINYDDLPGKLKKDKVRELILFVRRRNQLDSLLQLIKNERPDISMDFLSREEIHLTRELMSSWNLSAMAGQALLFLDVDSSIVQHNDWAAWLNDFINLGFGGIIAPVVAPVLHHSASYLERFLKLYLSGSEVGTAVLQARQQLWATENNPIGLYYAHYGPPDLHLAIP
ncbi:MAG: hypothetical protein KDE48_07165 [Anaerolineales bacterium]|nr:hypothetical protein [Anaerolineales bacterium]